MMCEHVGCGRSVVEGRHLCAEHLGLGGVPDARWVPVEREDLRVQVERLTVQGHMLERMLAHLLATDEFDVAEVRSTVTIQSHVAHLIAVLQRMDGLETRSDGLVDDAARLALGMGSVGGVE